MQLISTQDVVNAAKLYGFGGEALARVIMSWLQIDRINQIYANHYLKQDTDFLDSILQETGVNYEISEMGLSRIPGEGPFIIIANHPFGGIDGIILLKSILALRPDFKILANFLFQRVEPIKELVFAVNPFETHRHVKSSYNGLKYGLAHISEGHPLGIFPAGEVSAYQKNFADVTDRPWILSMIKFIKNANVPVIPMYFQGKNSTAFYLMGRIHPLLRTVKIPSEILNKKNEKIKVTIGKPISVDKQNLFTDIQQYGQYLRSVTYALAVSGKMKEGIRPDRKQKPIAEEMDRNRIIKEIMGMSRECILFAWQNYTVFCAPTFTIPNIAGEIGRLREITFREVGEGTNQSSDLDEFDNHYCQLFIWDHTENEIVGGYRIGKGHEIISKRGVKGFYIHTLFRIDKKLGPLLNSCIELGRSFIVKKYQRKPLSLFLLWKGIFTLLRQDGQYRYLIGPVSISNTYSSLSKQAMVEFIRRKYFNPQLARWVTPRNPYSCNFSLEDRGLYPENISNMSQLEQVIKDLEGADIRMPVLLKKYLSIGGKIVGFNLDHEFNDCLDCLLILDVKCVPEPLLNSLSKSITGKTEVMSPSLV